MRDYFTVAGRLHLAGDPEAWQMEHDGVSIEVDEASRIPFAPVVYATTLDVAVAAAGSRLQVCVQRPGYQETGLTMWRLQALAYVAGSATFHVPLASTVPRRQLMKEMGEVHEGVWSSPWTYTVFDISTDIIPTQCDDSRPKPDRAYSWQLLAPEPFRFALEHLAEWKELSDREPRLQTLQGALLLAPTVRNYPQSLLSLWSGLEALFETAQGEVRLRLSLHLAQLQVPTADRLAYSRRVRKAYDLRSGVSHRGKQVSHAEWLDVWGLACDACNAILRRGRLPTGADLLEEVLSTPSHSEPPTTPPDA